MKLKNGNKARSLETGKREVTMIFKAKQENSGNYRSVSLISTYSKIMQFTLRESHGNRDLDTRNRTDAERWQSSKGATRGHLYSRPGKCLGTLRRKWQRRWSISGACSGQSGRDHDGLHPSWGHLPVWWIMKQAAADFGKLIALNAATWLRNTFTWGAPGHFQVSKVFKVCSSILHSCPAPCY